MKKTKKIRKISINTLLLFVDIPILILLNENLYAHLFKLYFTIRFLMVGLIMIKALIKVFKTTFIMFKECGVIQFIFSIIISGDSDIHVGNMFENSKNVLLFEVEMLVLLAFFEYSMVNSISILESYNNLTIALASISLSFLVALISTYINKRCNYMIDTLDKKENMVS